MRTRFVSLLRKMYKIKKVAPCQFLPVIGRLVADALQGTLDPALAKKFAFGRKHEHLDTSRPHTKPEELDPMQLCSPEDFHSPSSITGATDKYAVRTVRRE
jgi:hypothetical protein